jgi:predicted peroxiredoxin
VAGKAVISLSTGLEDPEKVAVAFLVAVGAAESGRPTLMFQTKEAVRLALEGVAVGVACDGCPALPDLLARYQRAGGRYLVCPVCFNAKQLDKGNLLPNPKLRPVRWAIPGLTWCSAGLAWWRSGYFKLSGIGTPMSVKASRWALVGSASIGTVAWAPANRTWLRVKVARCSSRPRKL